MKLKDPAFLRTLMEAQNISARALAKAVGWKSQTSANRLLAGNVQSIKPEHAKAIAEYLHVHPKVLFAPTVATNRVRSGQ